MKKVSKKTGPVELTGRCCYVGVDVHKATYYVSILAEDGTRREFSTSADPDALLYTLLSKMGVHVLCLAHESGPTGYGLAWACQEAGVPVIVAASSRIARPIAASGKTDRLDCMKLADYLAKNMLKSIAIPNRKDHAFRELVRKGSKISKSRSKLRQEIKSFLLKNGLAEPEGLQHWSSSSVEQLRAMMLPHALRATLDLLLDEYDFLATQIAKAKILQKSVIAQDGKQESIKNLQTIPGVGEVISTIFLAEIFQPGRFETSGQVCAYAGLAPIISQSGSSKSTARLRSVGQKQLRCSLVEGAWMWMAKEPAAKALYNRIRGKTNLPQKAIIAVARKLLIVLWRIAVENRPYRLSTAV